jgi:hypothetical protein
MEGAYFRILKRTQFFAMAGFLLLLAFVVLLPAFLCPPDIAWSAYYVIGPLALLSILMGVARLYIIDKTTLALYDYYLIYKNGFRTIQLSYGDIIGFRQQQGRGWKNITILSKHSTEQDIIITDHFHQYQLILTVLQSKLIELYAFDFESDYRELIPVDKQATAEKELRQLKKVKTFVMGFTLATMPFAIYIGLYFYNARYDCWICLLTPLLAIALGRMIPQYVKFSLRPPRKFPVIVFAILFSAIGLLFYANQQYNIIDYDRTFLYTLLLTVALMALLLIRNKELQFRNIAAHFTIGLYATLLAMYSNAVIIILNAVPDTSEPAISQTVVTARQISPDKDDTSYYLNLKSLAATGLKKDLGVDKTIFDKTKISDTVYVLQFKGALGIKWQQFGIRTGNDRIRVLSER